MYFNSIKETCLYVKDLNATEAFYRDKLGLQVIARAENRHVFFRAGTSVLLCFNPEMTEKETELPPHFATGNIHMAFEVPGEQYVSWKNFIQDNGIEVIYEKTWRNNVKSFYFKDPDGHVLEIVTPGLWDY
ncbi:MAG: VOC family protein [Cytophagaceae bacterium]